MDQAEQELELLKTLYPGLPPEQLLDVKERLDGYFEIVLETYQERLGAVRGNEPKANEIHAHSENR
jgi:hypothetical protein